MPEQEVNPEGKAPKLRTLTSQLKFLLGNTCCLEGYAVFVAVERFKRVKKYSVNTKGNCKERNNSDVQRVAEVNICFTINDYLAQDIFKYTSKDLEISQYKF